MRPISICSGLYSTGLDSNTFQFLNRTACHNSRHTELVLTAFLVVLVERAQSVYKRTERSTDLLESSTDRLQSVYELGERARTERTERHSDFFEHVQKNRTGFKF